MRRARAITGLLLLAALGLLLVRSLGRGPRAGPDLEEPPAAGARAAPEPVLERGPVLAEEGDARTPVAAEPEPERASGSKAEAGDEEEAVPDWDLVVEVVDDAFRPAGDVPLVLRWRTGLERRRASTDEEGRALFAGAGSELAQDPGHALRVTVELPLAEPLEALVERAPPPGEPVRLRLPPLGSVEVLVLMPDGTPAPGGMQVALDLAGRGQPREFISFLEEQRGHAERSTSGGRVLFEQVGLGLELGLEVDRAQMFAPGPSFPGERVTHTLQLVLDRTVLVFRAVDEQGEPVVGALIVVVSGGGNRSTDGRGHFEVQLEPLREGARRELQVTARGGRLSARLDLSRPFPPGRIDMGDLVLVPQPLIASGRVIDAAGNPVTGAIVIARPPQGDLDLSRSLLNSSQMTDEAGRFAFHGVLEGGRVQLLLIPLKSPMVEVPVGTEGIEIVASEGGGVAGRVLADPDVGRLQIDLQPEDGEEQWTGWDADQLVGTTGGDGSFSFKEVLPATYALRVRSHRDEVLAEIPDIVVKPGEVTRDPRIQHIDLRGKLHVLELRLVPPAPGFELKGGLLTWWPAGSDGPQRVRGLGSGPLSERVRVVTPLACIDLSLRVAGCRLERLDGLCAGAAPAELRLRHGLPVRLALPAGIELPASPLFLGVRLEDEQGLAMTEDVLFDARGELVLVAPEPGSVRVRWLVERREPGWGPAPIEIPLEHRVEIRDREAEQRIELAVTAEALAAALAAR